MAQIPSSYTLTLHALPGGHFTLPTHQFLANAPPNERQLVPSLCFLIQHTSTHPPHKTTRILFDLGLRRDLSRYPPPIQNHTLSRQPITTAPDVVQGLARGGLAPRDVDFVVYSHVHWDHIGSPADFQVSVFVVGHGSRALLSGPSMSHLGSHSFFEGDLLPEGRWVELSDPESSDSSNGCSKRGGGRGGGDASQVTDHHFDTNDNNNNRKSPSAGQLSFSRPWLPHPSHPTLLPQTLDFFGDGSVYIVNAPGHLQGHINLLVSPSTSTSTSISTTPTGTSTPAADPSAPPERPQPTYLAGDALHDARLLTGSASIGTWTNDVGRECCIHVDRERAAATIARIRRLREEGGVEVVFAHDYAWEAGNAGRFFGGGGL